MKKLNKFDFYLKMQFEGNTRQEEGQGTSQKPSDKLPIPNVSIND